MTDPVHGLRAEDVVREAEREIASIRASITGGSLGFAHRDEDRQAVNDYKRHAQLLRALIDLVKQRP